MAGENIPIYHVLYETMVCSPCNAIIAIQDHTKIKGLLEKALEGDENIRTGAEYRKVLAESLKILNFTQTKYHCDKEGAIYFQEGF